MFSDKSKITTLKEAFEAKIGKRKCDLYERK